MYKEKKRSFDFRRIEEGDDEQLFKLMTLVEAEVTEAHANHDKNVKTRGNNIESVTEKNLMTAVSP